MTIETIRRVIDEDEDVSIDVRPHADNATWVTIQPTNRKSEDYYGAFSISLPHEIASSLGLAITRCAIEVKDK